MTLVRRSSWGVLSLVATLTACADYGSLDADCTPESPHIGVDPECFYADVSGEENEVCVPSVDTPTSTPTFDEVAAILVRADVGCDSAPCHGGVPNGNIKINAGDNAVLYEELTTSRGLGKTNTYVVPGDPDSSWMHCNVRKPGAEGTVGQVMPQARGLEDADIRVIEDWILNGAPGP